MFLSLYRRGASIVLDSFRVPDVYSRLLFNPLCFFLYENVSQFPEYWQNVSSEGMGGGLGYEQIPIRWIITAPPSEEWGIERMLCGWGLFSLLYCARKKAQKRMFHVIIWLYIIPQVSLTFTGNRAVVASAVFMTNLDLCSWLQFENPYFDPARVFRWGFVHFRY